MPSYENGHISREENRFMLHEEKELVENNELPISSYNKNSFINLLSTLHQDKELTDEGLDDLQEWIRKRRSD